MRITNTSQNVKIPEGVTVKSKNRIITVSGPRGKLTKNCRHLQMDIYVLKPTEAAPQGEVKVEKWFGRRKEVACVRTICTHLKNMMIGVTKGYQYKMRTVYAHFPINTVIDSDGRKIEIRNFLGEKHIRYVAMLPGVKITASKAMKDELVLEGNDIEKVSQSAATIHQSCKVRDKDIRKFLDGIYVSEKTTVVKEEA